MPHGRASGERFNQLVDDIIARVDEMVDRFEEVYMEDGFPPGGYEPASPRQQWQTLRAAMLGNDPRYFNDPAAIKELQRLSVRYGDPQGDSNASAAPIAPTYGSPDSPAPQPSMAQQVNPYAKGLPPYTGESLLAPVAAPQGSLLDLLSREEG